MSAPGALPDVNAAYDEAHAALVRWFMEDAYRLAAPEQLTRELCRRLLAAGAALQQLNAFIVNLVARLTSLCGELGESAVLSETIARSSQLHVQSLGRHALKGIPGSHEVFRLHGPPAILSVADIVQPT
ncbi:MAG TPA: hypothetical protein VF274_04535 [Alphaproteobacteria bacterium]|jgi:hypothetical protein